MTIRSGHLIMVKKIDENEKRKKPNPVSGFGNNPIYPVLSTWISTWTEP
jgi:hypothetical protein